MLLRDNAVGRPSRVLTAIRFVNLYFRWDFSQFNI